MRDVFSFYTVSTACAQHAARLLGSFFICLESFFMCTTVKCYRHEIKLMEGWLLMPAPGRDVFLGFKQEQVSTLQLLQQMSSSRPRQ